MNFRNIDIKRSYTSYGDNNIVDSFLLPLLQNAILYKRSVGFFSSNVLKVIADGITSLVRKNGHIQLVASPNLSREDIYAIQLGYEERNKKIEDVAKQDFSSALSELNDEHLIILEQLVAEGFLDIKIAVTERYGIYHDKFGILEDSDHNVVVFFGSANSSQSAYKDNYEKIRTLCNWNSYDSDEVENEIEEFDKLWNNTNSHLKVYDFCECAQNNILKEIEYRQTQKKETNPIQLRNYQQKAIDAWIENNYRGFFVMATGTGKTWTAIYAAKTLFEKHPALMVISAPYKHLIKQWEEDIRKVFNNATIILVSSENPIWEEQITNAIIHHKYDPKEQIIIISTIKSFNSIKFEKTIQKSTSEKLLIVDEAHRFTQRNDEIKDQYKYMLGLSATPYSGKTAIAGKELMNFFGGQVFDLPIETALKLGYLVPYHYYPVFVYATPDEEDHFNQVNRKIASCFDSQGNCINIDLLHKLRREKIRIIGMAENKIIQLPYVVDTLGQKDHLVVYCGDGRLFYDDSQERKRHITVVKQILYENHYKPSQFTADEDMNTRMKLVNSFNNGDITALAAIRCLDEGINIPSIRTAVILTSNDDYREFVQRRGRILRLYKGKDSAVIIDFVVLPSRDMKSWAQIEFRRFWEYARLSLEWEKLKPQVLDYLYHYDIREEEILFNYDDDSEEEIDE